MSRACRIILTLLLVGLSCAAVQAGAVETALPRVVGPPTLDGRLDDWPALPQVVMADASDWHPAASEYATYSGPEDISAEVRLAWDNQNLYVAIQTRDDNLVRVKSASEIDHGDSVVLALAAEGSQDLNQFVIALLKGTSLVWRSDPAAAAGEMKLIGRAIWARADEGGAWRVTYELSIPWSELSGLRPLAGGKLTVTVSACDDDGAGLKGCLERAVKVEISNNILPVVATPPDTTDNPALTPTFSAPEVVRFDARRFLLRGQDTFLLGGAVDYTRLPKETWAGRLALLKAAGMNTVGLTVPWAYHQPAPDKTDLGGLRDLFAAISQAGLYADVNVGPFAGETLEAGGVPAWYLGLDSAARQQAADAWMTAMLNALTAYQITADGPVAAVTVRPLPGSGGRTDAASLTHLASLARSAGLVVPVLTANAPAARDNSRQPLANLLDSLSFYEPPSFAEVSAAVRDLAAAENGPAVVSALPGRYATPQSARESADTVRIALARGAGGIIVSDFAPGVDPSNGPRPAEGVVAVTGTPTDGYGEMRLVGDFGRLFGAQLARAVPAEGVLRADDREVQTAVRLGDKTEFIFLWSEKGRGPHQVRLTYSEPGTATVTSIPAAGAITLPAQGAKVFPLDVPVGRGVLRYATSELAGLHAVGDRTLLVVYGDQDTPGELALRWPGPPLVVGEVLRQDWNPDTKTLTLDYYHQQHDQYLLVDDLLIAILSRERAAAAAEFGEPAAITLSAGMRASEGTVSPDAAKAVLHARPGVAQITAALPAAPSAVLLDGKPVQFTYTAPARVFAFTLPTGTYEKEQEPPTTLARLGRSVIGGPPKIHTSFDRAQFLADAEAPKTEWTAVGQLGRAPEALGLQGGEFARLRTRVDPADRTKLAVTGASDPLLVFVNGKLVSFEATGADREADIAALLLPGENEISLLIQLLPREPGVAGLRAPGKRLPVISLRGEAGALELDKWEVSPGLAGEVAGWAELRAPAEAGSVLRLGSWRDQGKRYQDLAGVGWYRFPFALPKPDAWEIPYEAHVTLTGSAQLYLNGVRIATLLGSGSYVVPLPSPPLAGGGENLLAVALYDPAGKPALDKVEIVAVQAEMTRRRQMEIRF